MVPIRRPTECIRPGAGRAAMLSHRERPATPPGGLRGSPPRISIPGTPRGPGGSVGRPLGRVSRFLGASGTLVDATASTARPFLPRKRETRSYWVPSIRFGPLGRYAEAEPLYERLLAVEEKALGPEHPDLDESLTNYAALLQTMGRDAEAARMEARAKAIRNPISPPGRARRAT